MHNWIFNIDQEMLETLSKSGRINILGLSIRTRGSLESERAKWIVIYIMRPFLCNTVILSFSFYSWCKVRIWNANSVSHSRVAKCSQYFLYIFPFQKFAVQNFQFNFNFCTDHFWKVEFTVFQVKSPHVSSSHFVPVWYPDAKLKLLSGYIF